MSKERLQQIRDELEATIKKFEESPFVFDLFVSSGGDEEHGYYFSVNGVRRP